VSVLRNLEAKLEGLVEGAFSRAFRSQVQPVELARKLAKEMEDAKSVSLARTYVPNQYWVFLSPEDRAQFESYEDGLKKELSDYLLEHARSNGLALLTRPTVELETDDRLSLGEFGIQAKLVRPAEAGAEAEAVEADFGHTMVYSTTTGQRRVEAPRHDVRALLVSDDKRTVVTGDPFVIGRSRECDLVLDDPNVSRRHAELRREDGAWAVHDLGSTNGIKLNGRRSPGGRLSSGDEITLGLSRLTFEQE
jgi:FhaA, N-terminal domain/FHA domain